MFHHKNIIFKKSPKRNQNPLSYILYNESKHNIVALVGKANKPAKFNEGQACITSCILLWPMFPKKKKKNIVRYLDW